MKRTRIRAVRPTRRRGEPSEEEKQAAREFACNRAGARCEMPYHSPQCTGIVPLEAGHLAHLKAKRRFGWRENEATGQRHLWTSPWCHYESHAYGPSGLKPVPPK
jgi:hypothetical protein